ncbi:MAG: bifunctional riboflavin kinase/FAD synthetase [Planctomycetia bacterium]|nr:bifunctional riboflavin kinase/FAD synthetase [Planctomycetia bacterium]
METIRSLNDYPSALKHCVVSIGKFDGLHLGHRRIIQRAVALARNLNAPAVAFTFEPTPAKILRPQKAPCPLCDPELRIKLMAQLGLDAVVLFPTTREFLEQSAHDFFLKTLVQKLDVIALVEGHNFHFGRNHEGNELLTTLCREHNVTFEVVDFAQYAGQIVSSSAIRAALANGDVSLAHKLLGRPYALSGIVGHGDQRGRTLGYPTANLVETTTYLPGHGLYAALARLQDGRTYAASVNLGGNPTFGVTETKIESYLLDFHGDLYDQALTLEFRYKLRDVVHFPSQEAFLQQLRHDVARTRELLALELTTR